MTYYPIKRIYEESAFIAYYLHWDRDTILQMPHGERRGWCDRISEINKTVSGAPENIFDQRY